MAFSGMSPGHPDAVGTFAQSNQRQLGAHPAGAGDPDYPNIGRVFHSVDTRKIGSAIAAPVAQKSNDCGFPI